jgi:N-acetylmuramoyl-L-alanine amidase
MNRRWRPSFARRLFGSASWWRRSRQRRQLRPNSIGSRRVVESSYPGRLVPQRHRLCLCVPILDSTRIPAVLLEASSIVNRDEQLIVSTPAHRLIIASAFAQAVEIFCAARSSTI